jgi:transforming growth factor-beta-induced protein
MKKFFSFTGLIVILSMILAACAPAVASAPTMAPTRAPTSASMPVPTATPMPEPTQAPQSIVDIAVADGRFTTLVTALKAAGLVETLQGEGPFTVFAPTDEAFAKLPAGTVEALLNDPEQLKAILLYHVVAGKVMSADAKTLNEAETVGGEKVIITSQGEMLKVNDSQVVLPDIEASNGVIHAIDAVLLPPQKNVLDVATENGSFTTLLAAIQAAGLEDTLKGVGPFTVFAPSDEAFAKLPAGTVEALLKDPQQLKNILLYHVTPGKLMASDVVASDYLTMANNESAKIKTDMDKAYIDTAEIVATDVEAGNGVIHVIDSVILPGKTVVDMLVNDGRFTTLVAAVEAAGLVETLQGVGPFTVFAPTDEAFAKLPAGTVDALLQDIPTLTSILLYHVVPGDLLAADVTAQDYLATAQSESARIKVEDDKAYINEAQITNTDIQASNGVIHVIDTVIQPGNTIVDVLVNDGRFTTLVAAVQAAELVDALNGKGPLTVFAPTDEAFAKLPAGTVDALLKDIPTLTNILLYHVVEGAVKAEDVVKLTSVDTLAGQPVSIKVEDGKVYINEAQVIIADIVTSNGIIHAIDAVLLPPQ